MMFIFSVFHWGYPFWANLVTIFIIVSNEIWYYDYFEYAEFNGENLVLQKKLSGSARIWYVDQFYYAKFNGGVHFFCFGLEITYLDKLALKNKNWQFQLKFGT